MPGPEASGVDGGGVGIGRSAGMTATGPVVELDEEPPLVGAAEVRSGMKPLPSVGGLDGGGAAGGAGGGVMDGRSEEVGFGVETGGGGGIEGGPDGASDIEGEIGCFAGCCESGFVKETGGDNGAGGFFGASGCFTAAGVAVGQGFLLACVSRGFWVFMVGGGDNGDKLVPDEEAVVVGLLGRNGVDEGPLPEVIADGAGGLD